MLCSLFNRCGISHDWRSSKIEVCTFDGNHGVRKIESVLNEKDGRSSGSVSDAMCSACEMAVSQMQDELKQNKTEEHSIDYVMLLNLVAALVDCERIPQLPTASFTIGGKSFVPTCEHNSTLSRWVRDLQLTGFIPMDAPPPRGTIFLFSCIFLKLRIMSL